MSEIETISASEFKAKCLEIFDRLSARKLTRVTVTKRGKPVAVLTPPPESGSSVIEELHDRMRGMTVLDPDFDLTAPVLNEPLSAESGKLYE